MMKRTYTVENLGCANCAAKMEREICALPKVSEATLSFASRRLTVVSEEDLTEQLQVVAAINGVTKGTFVEHIALYESLSYSEQMQPIVEKLKALRLRVEAMIEHVETINKEYPQYKDFHARRLVESVGHIIITYLLAQQASEVDDYNSDAKLFLKLAEAYIASAEAYINSSEGEDVSLISEVQEQY